MLLIFDLMGTFVFASSGAVLAARAELDLFGTFVLSLAAGTAGGIARDVILGSTPPFALTDARYAMTAVFATGFVCLAPHVVERVSRPITVLDALGLGLFAVTGTWSALDAKVPVVTALLLGVLTAVGGGVVRDMMVTRVPVVLRREVYALAAACGSFVVLISDRLELHQPVAGVGAVAITALLRMTASHRNWHLPKPPRLS